MRKKYATRMLVLFLLEKKCRDSYELKEFAEKYKISMTRIYQYLSIFARKGIVRRYWIKTASGRKVRRYCIENVEKLLEKM